MTSPEPLSLLTWQDLAEHQDQVLARPQARRAGMSEDAWQWKLDLHLWTPMLPGVVVTHSGQPTDRQRRWGAQLRGGPGAALTGDAALVELGFRGLELRTLDVGVPDRPAVKAIRMLGEGPLYRPHSVRGLAAMVHPAWALRVVRAPWAVLHAVAFAGSDKAAEWRIAAVQQGLVSVPDLRTCLAALPSLKRRALVLTVLDDVEQGAHATSELEFLRLCRRNGLPVPDSLQVSLRVGSCKRYLDARFTRWRVSVEIDGAHHRWAEQWDADVLRANDVAIAGGRGEILLRFSAGNLRHDEARVVAQLRAVLTP